MSTFSYAVDTPDKHRGRGIEIMRAHPHLKKLIGFRRRSSVLMVFLIAFQLACGYGVALLLRNTPTWLGLFLALPIAFLIGGTISHWLSMGVHEASHRLVAKHRLTNRWIAIAANFAQGIPGAMTFWRHHLKHHTHLGIEGKDNDLATEGEIRWVGNDPIRKVLWMLAYPIYSIRARGFVHSPNRWEKINIAVVIVVNLIILYVGGWETLAYLIVSTYFGHCLLHPCAAHFIHEHYVWAPGQETYSYYGPLNWLNFHVGYHVEHHDIMSIPAWDLPKVRRDASDYYDGMATHESWTMVLWEFITRRDIGHQSRVVRETRSGRVSVC